MTMRIVSGLALGLLIVGAAQAECAYPKEPANTPDGATATQDQMVEGMKAIKEYNTQVTAYLACLEQEMNARVEAAGPDAPAEQIEQIKAIHTKRHNAAVEALEQQAARFNEQVKTFKARDKKS
jgi:hypothetical protein